MRLAWEGQAHRQMCHEEGGEDCLVHRQRYSGAGSYKLHELEIGRCEKAGQPEIRTTDTTRLRAIDTPKTIRMKQEFEKAKTNLSFVNMLHWSH